MVGGCCEDLTHRQPFLWPLVLWQSGKENHRGLYPWKKYVHTDSPHPTARLTPDVLGESFLGVRVFF